MEISFTKWALSQGTGVAVGVGGVGETAGVDVAAAVGVACSAWGVMVESMAVLVGTGVFTMRVVGVASASWVPSAWIVCWAYTCTSSGPTVLVGVGRGRLQAANPNMKSMLMIAFRFLILLLHEWLADDKRGSQLLDVVRARRVPENEGKTFNTENTEQ
jgi:hypothetical protein